MSDGTVIRQTPEDRSMAEPLTRSAYYDVAQRIDDVDVFGLYNDSKTIAVDLKDGHFEINGIPFSAQPTAAPTMIEGGKFKLLYFRDHQHEVQGGVEVSHEHQYRLGWEYTDPDGKVYTQTIVII